MSHLCSKSCKDPHRGPQDIIAFFCAAILFTWVVMNVVSCREARASDDWVPIQTIMLEGAGESFEGQVAIANVIRNRAKLGKWGSVGDFDAVCLARYQFSCWNSPRASIRKIKAMPVSAVQRAMKAWELSAYEDKSGHADHYLNPKFANPSWARTMTHTVTIGEHVFYKDKI